MGCRERHEFGRRPGVVSRACLNVHSSSAQSRAAYDQGVEPISPIGLGREDAPARPGSPRLLKNGAPAHEFTREDRARGGRVRAERIRRREELRERFDVAHLEDLAAAELDVLGGALLRLILLVSSDDDRVALRAVKEVLDRTLGRPRQQDE